ncbi:MAG: aminomethyltransferase family protein [Acidobacteria bacterium]|nr:aminomethyltransferase family protein [Acidobacteriota bacterium]
MPSNPLHDLFAASAARLGQYGGVETASVFSDVAAEFRELAEGCALYDLGWRAKIEVKGEDRVRWLNGMVTNNVKDLPVGRGNYNFVLNPQGRILGDLYAYNFGDHFLLDTERSQVEALPKLFEHFIIMDDVELADKSEALAAIGLQGRCAPSALKAAGLSDPGIEPMQIATLNWNSTTVYLTRMVSDDFLTYELWGTPTVLAALWKELLESGAKPVGSEALEKFRVAIGFPKYGTDIRERDLPQETEQKHALNFTKGCYIGQEIVERIRSRGNVHRKFQAFVLEGEVPERGAKLEADGKEVGELTSVARIPTSDGERPVALGYIRREALERHAGITYAGGEATPAEKMPLSVVSQGSLAS